jgi:hypothetical protein
MASVEACVVVGSDDDDADAVQLFRIRPNFGPTNDVFTTTIEVLSTYITFLYPASLTTYVPLSALLRSYPQMSDCCNVFSAGSKAACLLQLTTFTLNNGTMSVKTSHFDDFKGQHPQ